MKPPIGLGIVPKGTKAIAEPAPQQQVVTSWAIQDATEEEIRQTGLLDGLLRVAVAFLGALVVLQVLRPSVRASEVGGG